VQLTNGYQTCRVMLVFKLECNCYQKYTPLFIFQAL